MPANRHEEHDFESVCNAVLFDQSLGMVLLLYFRISQDRSAKPGTRSGDGSESLTNKVRDLEAKLKGNRAADKKPKDLIRAIGRNSILQTVYSTIFLNLIIITGKLDKKNDWQLSALEKKIEENQTPGFSKDPHEKKVPKWNKDAFTDKVRLFVTVSLHERSLFIYRIY